MKPASLEREISPPVKKRCLKLGNGTEVDQPAQHPSSAPEQREKLTPAAIEAGEHVIDDHLEYFCEHFSVIARSQSPGICRLGITAFRQLYERNLHGQGKHFVVHQHDHPISGA